MAIKPFLILIHPEVKLQNIQPVSDLGSHVKVVTIRIVCAVHTVMKKVTYMSKRKEKEKMYQLTSTW